MSDTPPICDYEGSDYRTRFWENQGREYEDQVERVSLRRLMPARGHTLLEVGAGFGRLADMYTGYERVVLLDYSHSLLCEARERLSADPRFLYVAANWYEMPFAAGAFDTLVQVRTLHHAANVPALLAELRRIARPNGDYILEFANKQNLKAILRYALRRQRWSPFDLAPIEFAALNFDFHPRWIERQLRTAGFTPGRRLTVSHFRIALLKKLVPTRLLVAVDSAAALTGNLWQLTPSVFIHARHPTTGPQAPREQLFACPRCKTPLSFEADQTATCPQDGLRWGMRDGVYDFKTPIVV